jgi:filamentous hemagglutinin family protein
MNIRDQFSVGDFGSARVQTPGKRIFNAFLALLFLQYMILPPAQGFAGDLPEGPVTQIGDPVITTTGPDMVINANGQDKTWIDWNGGFNIGVSNSVTNIGPSETAVMLHNDVSGAVSNIQGVLNGNCNVFLLNPNGVIFSSTAQVNVAGLVASSLTMEKDDFRSGRYILTREVGCDLAPVINDGSINAFGPGGVTLAGPAVRNSGIINADLGRVNLVGGEKVTLNISGNNNIVAAVTEKTLSNVYDQDGNKVDVGADNVGAITANGNTVYMEAEAVRDVFDSMVNNEGTVRAGSMVERDGKIMLVSDSEGIVQNTGVLDASGVEDGAKGGAVEMEGEKVGQFGTIHADATDGDGGNVNIEAREVVAMGSRSVTTANAGLNGDGGKVIAYSPDTALFRNGAQISAKGGALSGNGGFIEVSGKDHVEVYGNADISAANGMAGTFYIDPAYNISIQAAVGNLDGLSPNYIANNDTATIGKASLQAVLNANGTALIQTADNGAATGTGTVTFNTAIDKSAGVGTGTLTVNAADNIVVAAGNDITASSGMLNITFRANSALGGTPSTTGAVTINSDIDTAGGNFTATSAGDITTGTNGSITANIITLTTTKEGSNIGTVTGTDPLETSPLLVDATTINATTNKGHIIIKDTSGGVEVDLLSTAGVKDASDTTRVLLTAVGGAITSKAATTKNIDAWATNLVTIDNGSGTRGGAIGTVGTTIKTDVSVLSASADNGGVYIYQADDAGSDVNLILGNIYANTEGNTAFKNDDGIVVYNTDGGRSSFDVYVKGDGGVTLGGGIMCPNTLTIIAEDNIFDTHDGNDLVGRYVDLESTTAAIGQSANHLDTLAEEISDVDAVTGAYLTEIQSTKVGTIDNTGAGDVELTSDLGNLRLGVITVANGSATVTSEQGSITNNTGGVNVVADSAVLYGKTGIGSSSTDVRTTVGALSTTTDTVDTGATYVTETDALTALSARTNNSTVDIHYVNGGARTLNFAPGTHLLGFSDAALTTLGFNNTGGELKMNGVTIDSATGVLNITASTSITQNAGSLTSHTANLTAGTNIGAVGTAIATNVAHLTAAASDGGVYAADADANLELTASAAGTAKDIVVSNALGDMTINNVAATGAVSLTSNGSIIDGNGATKNITGTSATLVATNGAVGAAGDAIETAVAGALNATSVTGVFLTNAGNLTGLSAGASGAGNIAITNTGSVVLNTLSAAGDAVTLNASLGITDGNAGANNITADTLNVSAKSFGATGDKIETDVTTYNSVTTTNGGIFITDAAGDLTINTITAVGSGSNVYFSGAGNIALGVITAEGDDVTLSAGNDITDNNAGGVNVKSNTLDISAGGTVGGGGNPLELSVSEISTDVTGGVEAVNDDSIALDAAASINGKATPIKITAKDITILDNGGGVSTLLGGASLYLEAVYGNIVFLNQNDTLATVNGSITLKANYDGDPTGHNGIDNVAPGRIVAGNLSSGGANITLEAYSDITIGLLDAGAGDVTVRAASDAGGAGYGLIFDGNGGATNIIASTANLYARMHTAGQAELDRENAIANYAGGVAETNAKETLRETWETDYNALQIIADNAEAVKDTTQSDYTAKESELGSEQSTLDTMQAWDDGLKYARNAAQIVKDIASLPAAAAQIIPLVGDGGAETISASIDLAFSIMDLAVNIYEMEFLAPQDGKVQGLQDELDVLSANLTSATNDFINASDAADAASNCLNISQAAYDAAVVARDHAQQIRGQAVTSMDAVNAIGSSDGDLSGQLEVQAATVNVTTTGDVITGPAAADLIDATTVTLNTVGDVNITNNNTAGTTTVHLTTDEDINYTQIGGEDVEIDLLSTTDMTNGVISIVADGEIYGDGAGLADIIAPTINLTTTSGGIGTTAVLTVNATTALNVNTSADNGNVTISDTVGDLPIGTINAGSGVVTLSSVGAINDDLLDTLNDITASSLRLDAASGLGNTNGLETTLGILAATTGIGDIYVANTGGLIIGTVNGLTGVTITTAGALGNDIFVSAASPLTINAVVADAGGGNITLVADGTAVTDIMNINANITASGGNGNINLYAGNDINHNQDAGLNPVIVSATGAGAINYNAGVDYNGGTPQAGFAAGTSDITMVGDARAVSATGAIMLAAPRNIVVGALSTAGNVTVTANDSTYIVSDNVGAISESAAEGTANVTAATATLRAATGIGSADDIETNITALDALNSTSGNMNVYEIAAGTDLNVNRAEQTAAGNINVQTQNGTLTVAAAQNGVTAGGAGTVTLIAGDSDAGFTEDLIVNAPISATTGLVTLTSSGDDVIFGAAGDVTTTTGNVDVNAESVGGAGVVFMADNTLINAGSGQIDMNAVGDITLGGLLTTNATLTAVNLVSTAGGIVDGGDTYVDVVATAGRLVIDAATGVGNGNALETTVGSLDVDNATSNDIQIAETDALTVVKAVQATAGNINIVTGGTLTADSAGAPANVISTLLGGTITLDANGVASDIVVNDGISSAAGAIMLTADNDVTFAAEGDITSTSGNVTVTADKDGVASGTSGALFMADGALIDAGTGTITLGADEDITLGGLLTTNATGTAVAITTTSGGVVDGGDAHTDIVANAAGAVVTIDAVTGVGSANALDTQVAAIDIDNDPGILDSLPGVNGHIRINEEAAGGDLILQKAVQGDVGDESKNFGDISITTANGSINVTGPVTVRDGGIITVDANGAGCNLTVGGLVTSSVGIKDRGTGVVTAGNINLSADQDVTINSAVSNSNANVEYTANGDVNVIAGRDALINATISVVGSGNIGISAVNDVIFAAAGDLTSVTGNITVTADLGGGGAGALTMNDGTLFNAGSGLIALNADGDITLGGLLTTNATNTAVVLTTTNGGIVDGGDTYVDVVATTGRLVIDAATGVGAANPIETTVASIDIDNATSGDIQIIETNDLTVVKAVQATDDDINIVTTAGTLTVDSAGAPVNAISTLLGGTVTLDANGVTSNIVVNDGISSATGDITLNADNDVTFAVEGDITSTSGNVTVRADSDGAATGTSGSITMTDDKVSVTVIDAGSGNIALFADGNITVGSLTTTGNTAGVAEISITSGNGALVDAGDTAINIDADSGINSTAWIVTRTGIGTDADDIDTSVENLAARTITGDINIQNVGNINVVDTSLDAPAGPVGVTITGGAAGDNIKLLATDAVVLDEVVTNTGGGNILIASQGVAATNDLTINSAVTAAGGNGNILLYAGDTIDQNGVAVTAAGSGAVSYYAGVDYNNGVPQAGLATGLSDVDMDATATAVSGSGLITMAAPRHVILGALSTTGNVAVTANDSTYIVSDDLGEISESRAEGTANINAATATLRAATGVGNADDIETTITTLDVSNSVSGDINVYELAAGTDLIVNRAAEVTAGNINVQTENGDLTVAALQNGVSAVGAGNITLIAGDSDASFTENLVINHTVTAAAGLVTLTSSGNDVRFGAGGDVTTTTGNVDVNAESGVGLGEGVIFMADGAVINSGSAQIDMDAYGDITLGGLRTTFGADDAIAVTSVAGGIIDGGDADIDIVANNPIATVDLDAATGIGSANPLETSIYNLEATNTTSGDIRIAETDAINLAEVINRGRGIVDVTGPGDIFVTTVISENSGVFLNSTNGNILSNGGIIVARGDSTLRALGTIGTRDDEVQVDIAGELRVTAQGHDRGVSANIVGRVTSGVKTDRVEIFDNPPTPGLVLFNNRLMGGQNYGSGSWRASILSFGYGEFNSEMCEMADPYYMSVLQPWGQKFDYSGMTLGFSVIDDYNINGPLGDIDGAAIGMDIVPAQAAVRSPRLEFRPSGFASSRYYVIRQQDQVVSKAPSKGSLRSDV